MTPTDRQLFNQLLQQIAKLNARLDAAGMPAYEPAVPVVVSPEPVAVPLPSSEHIAQMLDEHVQPELAKKLGKNERKRQIQQMVIKHAARRTQKQPLKVG